MKQNREQGHRKWDKEQRMKCKMLVCIVGIILLLGLLIGRILIFLTSEKESVDIPEQEEPIHIPVVETLPNVWIMEADEDGLLIFDGEQKQRYTFAVMEQDAQKLREQVADITLTDGVITEVVVKDEKLNRKVLAADDTGVWVEGYGRLEYTADYRGYRIYGELSACTYREICFGYDYTDLVLEDGKVCAFLIAREEAMETIRVLIKGSDYDGLEHGKVTITSDVNFTIYYGEDAMEDGISESHGAGEVLEIERDGAYFVGNCIVVAPDVLTGKISLESVHRNQGIPKVRGRVELWRTETGIVVINELPLEEYLYSVVPSEMPASYPEEALRAQAICARTYAYRHMQQAGYPQYGAHVDDSTAYQVYNNVSESESTTTAVKNTYGELLFTEKGECADTFYYSTSCGVGSDANVWKTEAAAQIDYLTVKGINKETMRETMDIAQENSEQQDDLPESEESTEGVPLGEVLMEEAAFRDFITEKRSDDFEVAESWYRWGYEVKKLDVEHMRETLQKRYEANSNLVLTLQDGAYVSSPIGDFKRVNDICIVKRGIGGVADELVIETDAGTYKVITEHNIRYVLNDGVEQVFCQDGKRMDSPNLLPSAFFVIDVVKEKESVVGYSIIGGGFGHGVGMSQNGAKAMAKQGYTAEEILRFFYENCRTENIYEE